MSRENVKWYGKCVESLLFGHKESWVCKKVVEYSSCFVNRPKEEIIMERLLEILSSIRSDIDFANEDKLIDDGILDSFDIVSIVAELCAEYDVTITVDMLEPENFNSAAAIHALVERLVDEM